MESIFSVKCLLIFMALRNTSKERDKRKRETLNVFFISNTLWKHEVSQMIEEE